METIDIEKLDMNQPADYESENIPYKDIILIAEKVNEIVDFINFSQKEKVAEFNQLRIRSK